MEEVYIVIEHIHTPFDNEVKTTTFKSNVKANAFAERLCDKYLRGESVYVRKTEDCKFMGSLSDTYGWQYNNPKEDRFARVMVRSSVVLD